MLDWSVSRKWNLYQDKLRYCNWGAVTANSLKAFDINMWVLAGYHSVSVCLRAQRRSVTKGIEEQMVLLRRTYS